MHPLSPAQFTGHAIAVAQADTAVSLLRTIEPDA